MDSAQRAKAIEQLIAQGFAPWIAPRAVDELEKLNRKFLGGSAPAVAEHYFFQGFMAGYVCQAQYN